MSTRKTTQYPLEFKKSSAKLAVSNDQSIKRTSEELGVNVMTLRGWIKKYTPQGNASKSKSTDKDLLDENRHLKKENTRLLEERDILKKAAAYFAKETL